MFEVVTRLRALLTLLVVWVLPVHATEIYWVSDPVRPGETVLLIGEDFGSKPRVRVSRPGSQPKAIQRAIPELRNLGPQQIAFKLPADLGEGVFSIEVEGIGKVAHKRVNAPTVYWAQGDLGLAGSPSGWLRVFGRNIQAAGHKARLELRSAGAAPIVIDATKGDLWDAQFFLPSKVALGEFDGVLFNGAEGDEGTKVGAITIKQKWVIPKS